MNARCLLLALNCRAGRSRPRQLSGVKQPRLWLDRAAANDPKWTRRVLFDHLVGGDKQSVRDGQPEGFGGLEVDDEYFQPVQQVMDCCRMVTACLAIREYAV
jgi:hypothetical protein